MIPMDCIIDVSVANVITFMHTKNGGGLPKAIVPCLLIPRLWVELAHHSLYGSTMVILP